MTALANSIQQILEVQTRRGQSHQYLPTTSAVNDAYDLIKVSLGEGKPIELLTPKESEFWVSRAYEISKTNSWDTLSRTEIKSIGQSLWYGDAPLVEDSAFLKSFLQLCENQIRKSLCHALIWVYLFNYGKGKFGTQQLGRWLAQVVLRWDWVWADRQRTLKLFGDNDAPEFITEHVFKSQENVTEVLTSYGLSGNLQSGGMVSAAFSASLENFGKISKYGSSQEILSCLERILDWACLGADSFIYSRLKTYFINSLLLPWENQTPSPDVKAKIQGFLVDHFDDPRRGTVNWIGTNESAQRIIRSWLVERALEQFLDVVDELAIDHQWKYRRAFWMAYHEKGIISDAWVAFASNGASQAKMIASRTDDKSWLSFADLRGTGDPNHAALILRIGDLTIVDFSHNGKWRIWDAGSRNIPRAYEKEYSRNDLLSSATSSEGAHQWSERGTWQKEVAGEIFSKTGIKMSSRDYMP